MTWLEQSRVGYVFGLAGNRALLRRIADLAEDVALRRMAEDADKVRDFGDMTYAARSWKALRRVVARVEATRQGGDSRFIVTNLKGRAALALRGSLLRPRPGREPHQGAQAAPRLRPHLKTKATANQFRLLIHTLACWLLHALRGPAPLTRLGRSLHLRSALQRR